MSLNILLKFFSLNDKKIAVTTLHQLVQSVYLGDMADNSRKVNESEHECFHWYSDGFGLVNSQFEI